jgi:hypothetical protein
VSRSREELLENDKVKEIVLNDGVKKSYRFKMLFDEGLSVSEISKVMDSVYSFVYGVIDKYSDGEIRNNKEKKGEWKEKFIEDFKKGLSVGEISKKYNKNYSYVWVCCDSYRKEVRKKEKNK